MKEVKKLRNLPLTREQVIERLLQKNIKGGGNGCPPPRLGPGCPPPRL